MATSKITLMGMYRWFKVNNDDLFKNLSVPSGITKSVLEDTILMNGAEFEVLYSDADFFQEMIGNWSTKWQRTMKRWVDALAIDYAPLENYDRQEEWTDKSTGLNSDTKTASDEKTENKSDNTITSAVSSSTGSGNTENKKAAYDSSTYSPYEKADTSSSGNNTSNGVEAAVSKQDGTLSHTENGNSINTTEANRTGRAHGNIGVTTSQQMLEAELDVSRFNLYDEISYLFISEFCIYTY